jgi:hypothetical protein
LPRPLAIPGVMTLATLGDVRTQIERHLQVHATSRLGAI